MTDKLYDCIQQFNYCANRSAEYAENAMTAHYCLDFRKAYCQRQSAIWYKYAVYYRELYNRMVEQSK